MSRVQVLLSTYNGAAFLEPLLQSVREQDHPDVSLLVRDDGSTDSTCEVLRRRADRRRLHYDAGAHVGAATSFFELLERADPTSDFFAFCDQDDVWLPAKLSRAVGVLQAQPPARPALYCGRQILVDCDLNRLGLSRLPRRGPAFQNALVENMAVGCTVVINSAARAILTRERPHRGVMHDWWAYLVVAAFGTAVYDAEPHVLYRQHGGNAIGTAHGFWRNWKRRADRLRRQRQPPALVGQALELRRVFGKELDERPRRILQRFIDRRRSWLAGVGYALTPDVFRQARLDDLVLRTLIALRRI